MSGIVVMVMVVTGRANTAFTAIADNSGLLLSDEDATAKETMDHFAHYWNELKTLYWKDKEVPRGATEAYEDAKMKLQAVLDQTQDEKDIHVIEKRMRPIMVEFKAKIVRLKEKSD